MAKAKVEIESLWLRNDIARLFNVDPVTIKRWEKAGKLPEPACKIKQRSYWRPGDVKAAFDMK